MYHAGGNLRNLFLGILEFCVVVSVNRFSMIEMHNTALCKKFETLFQVTCSIATLGTLIWCGYEFAKNEDLCQVTFKKFHKGNDGIYPHVSLCFEKPFSRIEHERYGEDTLKKYFMFLEGKSQDQKWLNSNYNDFTFNIDDHLIAAFVEAPPYSGRANDINTSITTLGSMKCLTVDLPSSLKVHQFWLAVQNSIFPAVTGNSNGKFLITITYPHQIFRISDQFLIYWPKINNATRKSYMTDFEIKGVEILKKRSTPHNACIESSNYDEVIMQRISELVNCTPLYWKLGLEKELHLCNTLASYAKITDHKWRAISEEGPFESHGSPCHQIKKLEHILKDHQLGEIDEHATGVIHSQGKGT